MVTLLIRLNFKSFILSFNLLKNHGQNVWWPTHSDGTIEADDVDYLEAWHQLEQFKRESLVRHIGVSNFNRAQLERLLTNAQIAPEVLQVIPMWLFLIHVSLLSS